MKVIALIPARGGSKGIPRKNICNLAGQPLISWSIAAALDASCVDEVYVSTEDDEIASVAEMDGVPVIERPADLAQDETPTEPVMLHAAEELGWAFDYMVLLQPTSPIRPDRILDMAITRLFVREADSLLTVHREHGFRWSHDQVRGFWYPVDYPLRRRPRRQDRNGLMENGNIFITSRKVLQMDQCRLGGRIETFTIPRMWGLEIDEPDDLWLAEQVLLYGTTHGWSEDVS